MKSKKINKNCRIKKEKNQGLWNMNI